jgi:hypothetical protein
MSAPNGTKHIILGNGPGLNLYQDVLISLLKTKQYKVWGVNRIYRFDLFKDSKDNKDSKDKLTNYIALDRHLWQNEKDKIFKLRADKYYCCDRYLELLRETHHQSKIETFRYTKNPYTFSVTPGLVGHGYTTTYAAIQLAVQQGAKEIQLFGVDFAKLNEVSHFYGTSKRTEKFWSWGKESMLKAMSECEKLNIEIICNTFNKELNKDNKIMEINHA